MNFKRMTIVSFKHRWKGLHRVSVINYTENIFADVYLITEHGDLYNLDGCNNRIALLL